MHFLALRPDLARALEFGRVLRHFGLAFFGLPSPRLSLTNNKQPYSQKIIHHPPLRPVVLLINAGGASPVPCGSWCVYPYAGLDVTEATDEATRQKKHPRGAQHGEEVRRYYSQLLDPL